MIAIVISACLTGDPSVCKDYRIPLAADVDSGRCMFAGAAAFRPLGRASPGLDDQALALHVGRRAGSLIAGSAEGSPDATRPRNGGPRGRISARRERPCAPGAGHDRSARPQVGRVHQGRRDARRRRGGNRRGARRQSGGLLRQAAQRPRPVRPRPAQAQAAVHPHQRRQARRRQPRRCHSRSGVGARSPISPTRRSRARACSPPSSADAKWMVPTSPAPASPPTSRAPA